MIGLKKIIGRKNDVDWDEKIPDKNAYIILRLPRERITEEFEGALNNQIRDNFTKPKIEVATIQDAERLTMLHNRSFMTSGTPFRALTPELALELITDPKCYILIARLYGTDAGFIIVDLYGENDQFGLISALGIIPRFQRKGLATVLAYEAWNRFLKENVKELRCEVYVTNNSSLSFVTSLGFEEFDMRVFDDD